MPIFSTIYLAVDAVHAQIVITIVTDAAMIMFILNTLSTMVAIDTKMTGREVKESLGVGT